MALFPKGMTGFGGALKESYPLLLAMGSSMQQGQSPFAGAPMGLATMMAMQDKRKEEAKEAAAIAQEQAEKAQAQQMLSSVFGNMAPPAAPITPMRTPDAPGLPRSVVDAVDRVNPQYSGGTREEFIQAMLPHAMRVSQQTGIDPRLVIAQAAQETGWGKSAPNNNYFGIKSHGRPGGSTLSTMEHMNGQNVQVQDSFRGYSDMGQSADDYANFIKSNPRYRELLAAGDLNSQVQALGQSGYATDPNYASSVGRIARSIQIPGTPEAQQPSIDPQRMAAIMASDRVPAAVKQVLMAQYMQQTQGQQPPDEPAAIQALRIRAQEAGLRPGTPEYQQFMATGGTKGPLVDMSGANFGGQPQPTMGTIPQGYAAVKDPNEPSGFKLMPIPGGPEDTTEIDAAKAQGEAQKASVVLDTISSIREDLTKSKQGGRGFLDLPEVGIVGSRLGRMGLNQEAVNVKRKVEVLQSVVAFDRLQKMREESPTGGALGAVSERELALLQAAMGVLATDVDDKTLLATLDKIEPIMKKFAAYPNADQYLAPEAQNMGQSTMTGDDPLGLFQ